MNKYCLLRYDSHGDYGYEPSGNRQVRVDAAVSRCVIVTAGVPRHDLQSQIPRSPDAQGAKIVYSFCDDFLHAQLFAIRAYAPERVCDMRCVAGETLSLSSQSLGACEKSLI